MIQILAGTYSEGGVEVNAKLLADVKVILLSTVQDSNPYGMLPICEREKMGCQLLLQGQRQSKVISMLQFGCGLA